jgi:WD40 repeat protein
MKGTILSYSPDATLIVLRCSGDTSPLLCVLDALTGAEVYGPLKGHQISIGGTVFTADGSRFASVSHDSIHARETKSGAKICAIVPDSPSKGWTRAIAFSSDGTRIISALQLELFTRDSTPGVRLLGPFVKGHNAPVYSIACNEDRIVSVTGWRPKHQSPSKRGTFVMHFPPKVLGF